MGTTKPAGTLIPVKIMFDVKRKKYNYNTVIECGERCQNIFYWVKKDLFGCFRIEEIRDKGNKSGLNEGGVTEIETTVLHSQCSLLRFFALYLLTCN